MQIYVAGVDVALVHLLSEALLDRPHLERVDGERVDLLDLVHELSDELLEEVVPVRREFDFIIVD